jgi:hypothetical protein
MNMHRTLSWLAAVLLLWGQAVQPAQAENNTLSIRLVRASQGSETDPQLRDVAALMRGNMAFSSFKLLESQTVALPASAPVKMGKNYKVALKGPAENLEITVTRGLHVMLKTRVVLQGRVPLVLGGIPAKDGTLLFVLNLAN